MSMTEKTLKVDEDTWATLQDLKLKMRARSMDEVIVRLLRERKA